jgi:o-succinylbenzoate synthase
VRFGVETALCNLATHEWGMPWHRRLTHQGAGELPVNALLSGKPDELPAQAEAAVACGYRFLKVKVARGAVAEEAAAVSRLCRACGEGVSVRLDANGAWSLSEALAFAAAVRGCPIAYVEDPVNRPRDIPEFGRRSGMRVALDACWEAHRPLLPGVAALVIKPTLRGGLSGALRAARKARCAGATPVVSAAFESGVGIRALVWAAAALGLRGVPVGIDTIRWLEHDIAHPPVPVQEGKIDVARLADYSVLVDR